MSKIAIVSAARTPVGSFNGALASLPAHELGRIAIVAAIERAGLQPADIDEVVMGLVLQAGAGRGPARQASVNAGIPVESPAWSLNQLCGSGQRAAQRAGASRSPARRRGHRHRWQPGEHEPVAARRQRP